MTVGAADVLALRAAADRARIADLVRLLPTATAAAADRRPGLALRLDSWRQWTTRLEADPDGWARWRDEGARPDGLVEEVLALAMTQLLRASGAGVGAFDAAEAMVGELVALGGLPPLVLGQTAHPELIDHAHASVAVRFPGSRVWDLPVLAHEVGHHAVDELRHKEPELTAARPLAERAKSLARGLEAAGTGPDRADAHTHELLADVLATVTCGPTYAVAALCLRVPRGRAATEPSGTHPAWIDRVATVRAALDRLTDATGRGRYRHQRASVVDPLVRAVLGVEPPRAAPVLDGLAEQAVELVITHRPGLVYDGADAAMEVAAALADGSDERPPGATVTAVLDGAWRWRLEHPLADPDRAAATAARWCTEVGAPSAARTTTPV